MLIVRSWPAEIPENRAYVTDQLPRLVMDNHDYRVLDDVDDDILLLEWDIAIGREELEIFADRCRANRDQVLVAPYRLYAAWELSFRHHEVVWAHRQYVNENQMRWITEKDDHCHLFGLGMTYLPRSIVKAFIADWPGHFSDAAISGWHYRHVREDVPIMWDVRPTHLHYRTDGLKI